MGRSDTGFYWIQFDDQEPPEIAENVMGRWAGITLDPISDDGGRFANQGLMQCPEDLECPPLVLFGPIRKPVGDWLPL